jgi:phosphoenolpyruvate synthase/pyruvate phosphate dikinase
MKETEIKPEQVPKTKTEIMLNLLNRLRRCWRRLPSDGVGLARIEFIINNEIKIRPRALLGWDRLEDADAKQAITSAYHRIREQGRVLRRLSRLRHRPHCGVAASAPGDRPSERFQDKRVCVT